MKNIINTFVLLLFAALVIATLSCGDDRPNSPEDEGYEITGLMFHNCEEGQSVTHFELTKDGDPVTGAQITINGHTVQYTSGGIFHSVSPSITLTPGDTHTLLIVLADEDTLYEENFVLPDTFTAEVLTPANNIYNTGGFVVVDFSTSEHAMGYIATVVPADSADAAVEWADYVQTVTSVQIGPEAFQQTDGSDVRGDYDIYILAYRETFVSWSNIFFPLPSQLPTDNIDTRRLEGTIGVGTLSFKDFVINTKL